MTISMYKASAPVFLRMLNNLDQLLEKAAENAKQRGFDPNLFVTQRLAPTAPRNDGRQTPMRGHPVFTAQHATATCCRQCLAR